MHYFFSFVFGYLVGSLPTAYLLVKWKAQVDIRKEGSGNVGTMNAFEVSGSAVLSTIVLVIDLFKGVLAVWLSSHIIGSEFWVMGSAGLGSVAGHNYSLWLKFRGGRGLATALGVFLSLGWIFVVAWCLPWILVYLISKDLHISNITASIIGPVLLVACPDTYWQITLPPFSDSTNFRYLAIFICLLLVVRHHDYLAQFTQSFTNIKS